MDRDMLERHLAQAQAHIETGYKNIARQRQVIAHMEREGQDTASARDTLTQFEESQALHIADRERILRELQG
jgi:hypothetical protein